MYFRQEHPTAFRTIATVIVAVVVLGIIGGIVLLSTGGADDTTTGRATKQATSAGDSVCGLPAGSQRIPTEGPAADWDTLGAYQAPRSKAYGPGKVVDEIRSCFAHSPSGALFAAANRGANTDAPGVDQVALVEQRFAQGPLFKKYLALARDGQLDPSKDPSTADVESLPVVAFQFKSYSSSSARLEIVYRASLTTGGQALIAEPVHMVWEDGDWKSYIDEIEPGVTSPQSLMGYARWDGAGEAASGSDAAATLGRAAPAWALKPVAFTTTVQGPQPAAAGASNLPCIKCAVTEGAKKAITAGPSQLLSDGAGQVAGSVASSGFEKVAQFFVDAMNYTLKNFLTAWMKVPDPDVSSSNSLSSWLTARTSALVAFLMIASVLVSAIKIAVTGQFEHLRQLGGAVARVVITGGLIATVLPLSLQIGDAYSDWILGQANPNLVRKGIAFSGFNPALLLIFGLFVMLVQVFQFFIMIFRNLAVMYLAVTITLFAAGSTTRTGKSGFD